MAYFDLKTDLSSEDIALRDQVHKFARDVMRPTGKLLDTMKAEETLAADSPLWPFLKKVYELGFHKTLMPEYYGGLGLNPLQISLVFEEMGWGSFGLSIGMTVLCFPFYCGCLANKEELIESFVKPYCDCTDASIRGCWAITEPDHGSNYLAVAEEFFSSPKMRGNVQMRLDGNEWVISGQKSQWVSGGTIATHALLHAQVDPSRGFAGSGVFVVPLDLPGVSKGPPLRKIGQRDLNQGEIFFDDVRVPQELVIVEPGYYVEMMDLILASANLCMANFSVGLARAAFEEAFNYSKVRVQGGRPLIEHYAMRQRLFNMFARVESCRAIARAATNLNFNISPPFVEYSLWSKTQCTQMAYDNAHEAIQVLGGYGLTEEYLTEKLFRDARATLIEDGTNESLAAHGGHILAETYPRPPLDF
jgi:alkylation response protein AidB-like acyl-CoA dehydrogenase